jgi:hypothetical protein
MIAILTKIFNYGQSTGIFAAGIAFILAVWKAVLPIAQAHVKTAQQKSLLTAIESFVAMYAQVSALSKTDRFNAVLSETLDFISDHGYSWANSALVKGLIENVYQEYKNTGKDVAPVATVPSSDVIEDPATTDTSKTANAVASANDNSNAVESDGGDDIKQLEGEVEK